MTRTQGEMGSPLVEGGLARRNGPTKDIAHDGRNLAPVRHGGAELEGAEGQAVLRERDRRDLGHVPVIHASDARPNRERLREDPAFDDGSPASGNVLEEHRRVQDRVIKTGCKDCVLDGDLRGVVGEPDTRGVDHRGVYDLSDTAPPCGLDDTDPEIGLVGHERRPDVEHAIDALQRPLEARPVAQVTDGHLGSTIHPGDGFFARVTHEGPDRGATADKLRHDETGEATARPDDENAWTGFRHGLSFHTDGRADMAPPGSWPNMTWAGIGENARTGVYTLPHRERMMDRIDDLEAFLAVVDEGSLTAAGRRLGRSLQSISRSLATLERGIGVELVQRTTRLSQPTEAGQAFYRRIKPALQELNEARLEAATRRSEPSGVLRIGASVLFGPAYLVPVIARFMERHPQIRVELKLSDRFVDLADEGLDLAVRIGDLPDSSLKARRLGELRRVFFGSPEYFDKHGRPEHPHDLSRHQCVIRSSDRQDDAWPVLIDGKPGTVRINGRFRADDTATTYAAVAQGLGIGFTPLWQIRDLVDHGVLELVLVAFEPPTVPIHAVWHGSKLTPAKTRMFINFLADQLECDRL